MASMTITANDPEAIDITVPSPASTVNVGTGFRSKLAPKPELQEYVLPGAGEPAPETKTLYDCKNPLLAVSTYRDFWDDRRPKLTTGSGPSFLASRRETIPPEWLEVFLLTGHFRAGPDKKKVLYYEITEELLVGNYTKKRIQKVVTRLSTFLRKKA